MFKKIFWIVFLIIVLILVGNIIYKQFAPLKVEVTSIKNGDLVEAVYGTGSIEPKETALIRNEIGGKVVFLNIEEGDEVKKGQLIIQTAPTDFSLQSNLAQSEINLTEVELEDRRRNFERVKELYEQGASTLQNLQTAETDLRRLEAMMKTKKASYKIASSSISKTKSYSPINGIVVNKFVNNGDVIPPQTIIAKINSGNEYIVEAEIDELDIAKIREGLEVIIMLDALPGKKFSGTVKKIIPMTDVIKKTSIVQIGFNDNPDILQSGLTATVNIITNTKQNINFIEKNYVVENNGKSYVWIVNSESELQLKEFKKGSDNGRLIEVLDGLTHNDKIITKIDKEIKPNRSVEIVNTLNNVQ